ncbi:MAG: ABC transporter ATP-binding protein [Clostridiales Family XIII bacterium]|jgi:putative ABC transport system ATP-binding protein|nr:ABC transporter ATP-binding protein [Clostridiales Family XIII bacterium]
MSIERTEKNEIIRFERVTREYGTGAHVLKAVDDVSFAIREGEFVVILGPSGAGKSTLLNLLGGMDFASSGKIFVGGDNIVGLPDDRLTEYRAAHVGFVFQFYNLIPTLTAFENIALTRNIVKKPLDARNALEMVGLADHADQFPAQLSGGEQQRVSIARAVAKNPTMLLCDEPTGALDSETGAVVLEMLQGMSRERGKTVVIVTHNAALANAADRVIRIRNGRISAVEENESPKAVSEVAW